MNIQKNVLDSHLSVLVKTYEALKNMDKEALQPTTEQYYTLLEGTIMLAKELLQVHNGKLGAFVVECPECKTTEMLKKLITKRTTVTCSCGHKFKAQDHISSIVYERG